MTDQAKTNNLNYLIVLSFENEEDRALLSKYYTPKVEIKDFNVLIGGKKVFDVPITNKEEAYKKITEFSKSNDYTADNLLDYVYFSKHFN